ncbi:hypothetical protein AAG747_01735 [Rapidithrix thailandica]|uniref:Uncharacterized protein n=1 Tax=Rapidithrix thailandica TaxID=413964 RepID=A0AAW9RYI2_9BACT
MTKNIAILHRIVILLVLLGGGQVLAQQALPNGRFLQDSVKLGEPVKYILTYKHSPDLEVFFPDSSYDFSPFEYIDKEFFPTVTDSTGSLDSVVYTLATFEIENIQGLAVPALIHKEDQEESDKIYPEKDQVALIELVEQVSDPAELFENTTAAKVNRQFDTEKWSLIAGGVLGVVVILGLVFNKPVRKAYRLKRLRNQHRHFMATYEGLIHKDIDDQKLEKVIKLWKGYTAKLVDMPLYSYTTKEIQRTIPDEKLNDSLKNIDRYIYAGLQDDQIKEHLHYLRDFSLDAFNKKVEEVKHA